MLDGLLEKIDKVLDYFSREKYASETYLLDYQVQEKTAADKKPDSDVSLSEFDQSFCDSLPWRERRHLTLPPFSDDKSFRTVMLGDTPVGIVGAPKSVGKRWIQIMIHADHRGKGYAGKAEELLVKDLGLKRVHATIAKWNKASRRVHDKQGYKPIDKKELESYHSNEMLPKYVEVFVKEY